MRRALRWLFPLALVFTSASAFACDKDGVTLFPKPGAVVPTNVQLILEGRGQDAERVLKLVGRKVTLASEGDQVSVEVKAGWKSGASRAAVKLLPQKPLKPDTRYELVLDQALPGAKLINGSGFYWYGGRGPDNARPTWARLPAVSQGRYATEEGGVRREVTVDSALRDESPLYLVVQLRSGKASSQTYFVPADGQGAVLGQDACSGSFAFEDGHAYTAQVEAFDAAGNRAAAPRPVEFQAPRPDGQAH